MEDANLKYYDECGNEIEEMDLLQVFHFVGPRKRKFYMYKVAVIENGHWYGRDVHQDHTFLFKIVCNPNDRIMKGTRIISRKRWDAPVPKTKKPTTLTPPAGD